MSRYRNLRLVCFVAFVGLLGLGACKKSEAPSKSARNSALDFDSNLRRAPRRQEFAKKSTLQAPAKASSGFRRRKRKPHPRRMRRARRASVAMSSATGGAASSAGDAPRPPRARKPMREAKQMKKQAQVWQRSASNTVLSKVSVGGQKYLVLKKMRVSVQIEGLRARTVIDHIYYNPYHRTLQGTFKYTLPQRASVSYYAMFVGRQSARSPRFFSGKLSPRQLFDLAPAALVKKAPRQDWGRLREARLVAAEKGRQVYENITRQRIDPALLEQDAPNTFQGRVFPIPARGYNRVIIAYEQTLPQLRDELVYRFRFPKQVADSIEFSIDANDKIASITRTNLRRIRCRPSSLTSMISCYWEQNKPDRDAVFYLTPKNKYVSSVAGFDPTDNKKYFMARTRVQLPKGKVSYSAQQGLFLLDTSLSANPDLFAAHVALMQQVLRRNSKQLKRFNVLFFDTSSQWAKRSGWIANTPNNRQKMMRRIRRIVLEGATNLAGALIQASRPSWSVKKGSPVDIFVLSDGQLNWGANRIDAALSRFQKRKRFGVVRFFSYQMGIGSENASIHQRLAREGGAVFPCLGRAELQRCALAHTRPAMSLKTLTVEGINAKEVLVEGRQVSIYPGALVAFAGRYTRDGEATVQLKGTYLGKPIIVRRQFKVRSESDLAPRAWAELAVNQLIELDDPALTNLIVSYSQHFHLANKHCSMLVLETDREYKLYGLNALKKEKQVRDVAAFITRWINLYGTLRSEKDRWMALFRKGAKQTNILKSSSGRAILSILRLSPERDFQTVMPQGRKLYTNASVSRRYLRQRLQDKNNFTPFVREAKRRLRRDVAGAIRALSSIVELHPSNPQALRLVGYYLMSWNRPAEASRVFLKVLERRSFEPHSYRDLARALAKQRKFALAACLYEIIISGRWHSRFGDIYTIAREEYALLMKDALRAKEVRYRIRNILRRRKSQRGLEVTRSRIRVTVTWNTDNTDIDLWVTEPGRIRCYYRHRRTHNGGELLQDITRGYGPERYQNRNAPKGPYALHLHFYGHRSNVLGNETHASVMIVLNAGTAKQRVIEKNIVLKRRNQIVKVANLRL